MIEIYRNVTKLFDENCYILVCQDSGEAVVVDPGWGAVETIKNILEKTNSSLRAVLLTHAHVDHVWESDKVSKLTPDGVPVPVYIPEPDAWSLDDPLVYSINREIFSSLPKWKKPHDIKLVPTSKFEIASGIELEPTLTPGHSAGSTVFLIESNCTFTASVEKGTGLANTSNTSDRVLLGGDVIFASTQGSEGSVGRVDLPTGSREDMSNSLRLLTEKLQDYTVILPGHGVATSWLHEKKNNPYVIAANRFKIVKEI